MTFDMLAEYSQAAAVLAREVLVLDRPGIDGHATVAIGERGKPFVWVGFLWSASWAAADTHVAAVRALQGTTVTIYDPGESQFDNILVLAADFDRLPKANTQGGATKYFTAARLTLLQVA